MGPRISPLAALYCSQTIVATAPATGGRMAASSLHVSRLGAWNLIDFGQRNVPAASRITRQRLSCNRRCLVRSPAIRKTVFDGAYQEDSRGQILRCWRATAAAIRACAGGPRTP